MTTHIEFNCCAAGSQKVAWENNGAPLVINMQEAVLHAFSVTSGTKYQAGQIVDFGGVKAIALSSVTVSENGTMAFLIKGSVNRDMLLKDAAGAPANDADFTAIMPSINPVKVSK